MSCRDRHSDDEVFEHHWYEALGIPKTLLYNCEETLEKQSSWS